MADLQKYQNFTLLCCTFRKKEKKAEEETVEVTVDGAEKISFITFLCKNWYKRNDLWLLQDLTVMDLFKEHVSPAHKYNNNAIIPGPQRLAMLIWFQMQHIFLTTYALNQTSHKLGKLR